MARLVAAKHSRDNPWTVMLAAQRMLYDQVLRENPRRHTR